MQRLNDVTESFKKNPKDIYFIYISTPDKYGHLYGPNSNFLKEELLKMDNELESFKNNVNQYQKNNFIYIGDHGMIEVQHEIDCESIILRTFIKHGLMPDKDFIYFLDSTMVRIWFLKEAEPNVKSEILSNDLFLAHGFFPNKDFLKENNIPIDKKFGDILWIARPGVLVHPDFFNDNPNKGMHGYDPNNEHSKGLFISNATNIEFETHEEKDLSYLFSIQKKLIQKFYSIN
jgi:predicted AlkP superfamily pyrophosphatase or phosphodiesterase